MASSSASESKAGKGSVRALLLDLEQVCFGVNRLIFDVSKSVLADKGIELTPALFMRYGIHRRVSQFLPALLAAVDHARVSADKLAPEIVEGIRLTLLENPPAPSPAVVGMLRVARERNLRIGALSNLDGETATSLMQRLDLTTETATLIAVGVDELKSTDNSAWTSLSRAVAVSQPHCLAVTGSGAACRAALVAGLQCVAVLDAFTCFEDCGGADLVIDATDANLAATLRGLVAETAG
jgi:hypothetical protein